AASRPTAALAQAAGRGRRLVADRLLQPAHLGRREEAQIARLHVPEADAGVVQADETVDGMAHGLAEPLDQVVPALPHLEPQPRVLDEVLLHLDRGGARHAVFEADALAHAL